MPVHAVNQLPCGDPKAEPTIHLVHEGNHAAKTARGWRRFADLPPHLRQAPIPKPCAGYRFHRPNDSTISIDWSDTVQIRLVPSVGQNKRDGACGYFLPHPLRSIFHARIDEWSPAYGNGIR